MRRALIICGPTGVGKTEVAIEVAERLGGEVISADSRQVYRYLNIGTAKPTPEQREKIPHHLIDIVDPNEQFTAADYGNLARETIREVFEGGKTPIVSGGTGLYLRALTEGLFYGPPADPEIRGQFERVADEKGEAALYQQLLQVDPEAAERIHPHDRKRIVRALEVFQICGKPLSLLQREGEYPPKEYQFIKVGLTQRREELYKKIEKRVDKMIKEGLLGEVRALIERGYDGELVPLKTVGYKEMFEHLEEKYSLKRAIELVKRNTRRYAKRQLTWFRKDKEIHWFEIETPKLIDKVVEEYRGGIIEVSS
jgi:tRNA dimethylallyltransferase